MEGGKKKKEKKVYSEMEYLLFQGEQQFTPAVCLLCMKGYDLLVHVGSGRN